MARCAVVSSSVWSSRRSGAAALAVRPVRRAVERRVPDRARARRVTFLGVAILFPLVARPMAAGDRSADPAARDPGQAGARERDAQPAADRVDGLRVDDRPRARGDGRPSWPPRSRPRSTRRSAENLRADFIVTTSLVHAVQSRRSRTTIEDVPRRGRRVRVPSGGVPGARTPRSSSRGSIPRPIEQVANLDPSAGALDALERGEIVVFDRTHGRRGLEGGRPDPLAVRRARGRCRSRSAGRSRRTASSAATSWSRWTRTTGSSSRRSTRS